MPEISVIIPCYNLSKFIDETLDSVLNQTFQNYEIVVVNDGSTEEETINKLYSLNHSKITVLHTSNQGLASARNTGIKQAQGKYILPLDADDKIASTYLEKARKILESDENIGIVYCLAAFFDKETIKWDLPEFSLAEMILNNVIFCSAFFRKSDWETVGGYKQIMKYGWEDYEFWFSIIELKRKVFRIPEYLFFYRQRLDSMANVMSREHLLYSHQEIANNHPHLFINNIDSIFDKIYFLKEEISKKQKELIDKDTKIHHLNLEILQLNETLLQKKFQLSDTKTLTKLLLKSIKKRFMK